jgi:hypothetical protein
VFFPLPVGTGVLALAPVDAFLQFIDPRGLCVDLLSEVLLSLRRLAAVGLVLLGDEFLCR